MQKISEHKKPICMVPWTNMILSYDKDVRCCCMAQGSFGKIGEDGDSIMDVWNSDKAQQFRQDMLDGKIHQICMPHCQVKAQSRGILSKIVATKGTTEFDANCNLLMEEFLAGKTQLTSFPPSLEVHWSNRCNYSCIMCAGARARKVKKGYQYNAEELKHLYPYVDHLLILGGEPLISKSCIQFIENFTTQLYPHGHISLFTNGTFLDRKMLNRFTNTQFKAIIFSVDAVTRETYEKIRIGGDFERVVRNMKSLADFCKSRNWNIHMQMNFVAMTLNFRELPLLPAFVRSLGENFSARINPVRYTSELMLENHPELHDELRECLEKLECELIKHGFPRDVGQSQIKNVLYHCTLAASSLRMRRDVSVF
jgi:uncharacterized Fe-S cluster-containing radical SAM superfamily protein